MGDPLIPGGYYLKARCIAGSDVARCSPTVRELWDYLLRNANHSDARYAGHTIERGQLFRTLEQIRDDLSWAVGFRKERYSEDAMKKAMKKLRSLLMIASVKAPGGVLITVCNYCKYQDPASYEGTNEGTNEGTKVAPGGHQGGTHNKKKEKKEKKEKNNPKTNGAVFHDLIPDHFKASICFCESWRDWEADRKERRKTLTKRAATGQLETLGEHTPCIAAKMLRQSIDNSWTGVFPLKEKLGQQQDEAPRNKNLGNGGSPMRDRPPED